MPETYEIIIDTHGTAVDSAVAVQNPIFDLCIRERVPVDLWDTMGRKWPVFLVDHDQSSVLVADQKKTDIQYVWEKKQIAVINVSADIVFQLSVEDRRRLSIKRRNTRLHPL